MFWNRKMRIDAKIFCGVLTLLVLFAIEVHMFPDSGTLTPVLKNHEAKGLSDFV